MTVEREDQELQAKYYGHQPENQVCSRDVIRDA